jgi:hypothetical protein
MASNKAPTEVSWRGPAVISSWIFTTRDGIFANELSFRPATLRLKDVGSLAMDR